MVRFVSKIFNPFPSLWGFASYGKRALHARSNGSLLKSKVPKSLDDIRTASSVPVADSYSQHHIYTENLWHGHPLPNVTQQLAVILSGWVHHEGSACICQ